MTQDVAVTFVIFAYNQENIVHEAIESAFSQQFSGQMEFLLTDDASSDDTFGVMQRMAARYDGPHEVRLNQNPTNIGAVDHVNRVFEMARGDLIIVNSGDDVSRPQRAALLHDAFTQQTPRPLLIHSPVAEMAFDGTPTQRILDNHDRLMRTGPRKAAFSNLSVVGASSAWNKELFEIYGPMRETGAYGDQISTFRALLLGRLAHVDEILLDYRKGGISDRTQLKGAALKAFRAKRRRIHLSVMRQRLADLRVAAPQRRRLVRQMSQAIATLEAEMSQSSPPSSTSAT